MDAGWIDFGTVAPAELHAICQGVAEARDADDAPVLLWGRCNRPHICLGASRMVEAEVDAEACRTLGMEVVRRPLGGGAVLVDPDQWCFFYVVPERIAPRSRRCFVAQCLMPVADVFRVFGLDVQPVGTGDLWLNGRKILGSGAATIGTAHVLGASFLMRFDARRFARAMRCPSEGFRDWLMEEVNRGMTDWAQHGTAPDGSVLREALQHHVSRHFGWRFRSRDLSMQERQAIAAAQEELREPPGGPATRRTAAGIKIRHGRYLLEQRDGQGWMRLVVANGRIERLLISDDEVQQALSRCIGLPLDEARLRRALHGNMAAAQVEMWTARILRAAMGIERVNDG